jgi:hypothetical protein
VYLTNKGEVRVINSEPDQWLATTGIPASFNTTVYHTLETVVKGSTLQVYLDGKGLSLSQNCAYENHPGQVGWVCSGPPVTSVSLPTQEQPNNGAAGIVFGDEDNPGQLSGQRAKNLVVSQAP